MVVKCIENSWSKDPTKICVKEGSMYNVMKVLVTLNGNPVYREGTDNCTWYLLLETGDSVHHSSCFAEIDPEEYFKDEEIEEIIVIKN